MLTVLFDATVLFALATFSARFAAVCVMQYDAVAATNNVQIRVQHICMCRDLNRLHTARCVSFICFFFCLLSRNSVIIAIYIVCACVKCEILRSCGCKLKEEEEEDDEKEERKKKTNK